ncbi:MAG: c-type cytochrome, partial [Planctomycetaceae bacterium]|nr:c-type cytochrome [Planctomycetaceae bacterium]
SGMTRYRTGALFGDTEVRPESAEFLVTQFNTHKVVHSVIQRDGATFRHIATRDLFISPDPDCHPTDVIEDADGSILVIDTGGWFRIGCPTSQVAKPQITGAIYRIRRKGTSYLPRRSLLAAIPAGEQVSPVEFAKTFRRSGGALRGAVVDRMVEESSTRPNDMMDALQDILTQNDPSEDGMSVAAYWTLSRMSDDASREWLQRTVSSPDHRDLALVSIRQLSGLPLSDVQRDALSAELIKLCASESSAIRRAAVTALGRIQPANRSAAAAAVLESLRGLQSERMMEHAATFALIQLADRETAAAALADANPQIRRAALIALDQMDGGNLQREQVVPLLDTDDPMLQKAVLDVISRHDGWAGEAFALVRDWIDDAQPDEGRQAILRGFLIARAAEPDVQQLVADSFSSDSVPAGSKLVLLEVMSRAAVDAWPAVWNDSLRGALAQSETDLRLQALRVVASRNLDAFDPELTALAASTSTDARLRSEAFAAVAPRLTSISDELFQFLAGRLQDSETPVIDKLRIVTGLSRAPLSDLQLQQLAAAFEPAGPAVAPALLGVYDRDASEAVGLMLVSRLQASPSAQTLSAGDLRRVAAHYPPSVLAAAAPLLAALEIDAARNAARLDELAATISGGNAEHGRELFHGKQSACSTCHRVNGAGAQVGPELSKIATIRQPRDLLESIVYPSQSFARGFEPYNVLLADGRVVSGIIARETATDVVLRTNDLSEIRIARTAIDEMQPSQTSIMPQGLEGRLTPDELRDLLAYLQSLK